MKILADVERTRREFNNRYIVVNEQGSLVLHEGQLFFVKDMRTKDIVNDGLDWCDIENDYVYDEVDEDDGYNYWTRTRGV